MLYTPKANTGIAPRTRNTRSALDYGVLFHELCADHVPMQAEMDAHKQYGESRRRIVYGLPRASSLEGKQLLGNQHAADTDERESYEQQRVYAITQPDFSGSLIAEKALRYGGDPFSVKKQMDDKQAIRKSPPISWNAMLTAICRTSVRAEAA
jgi:hypothetical protein